MPFKQHHTNFSVTQSSEIVLHVIAINESLKMHPKKFLLIKKKKNSNNFRPTDNINPNSDWC